MFGAWRSLLVRFWCPWVVFGRVGCLGGVQGADLVEMILSIGPLLAPFWNHFWSKTVMCLRCFLRCFCWIDLLWMLTGCGNTFERCLDHFFVFFWKCEYVKTSTACARELDFQGLEGFGSVYFCYFVGVGFGMAPGMDFEWFWDGFWEPFGFGNRRKTWSISGVIFERLKRGRHASALAHRGSRVPA